MDGIKPPEKPMMEVKEWHFEPDASGYRLPSEAQWEYVAAGRDEQRPYVWGKSEPEADSCHAARARGEAPNRIPGYVPATGFLPGVVPVGSFPKDMSRDGVMDMGGNVTEWCGDWYDDYDGKDLQDPFQAKQSATLYRVIRGGSWGYYSYSLRVADREYNTQVYPGYVYIGFRVALPQKK
ncbi:MAG: SUMF1/EgtB/PvdO family nonheme iron enzyme [Planctomycetes bacterium]|nr:SUMF1/EgtB/PvdO family nonheme iron enzyme [Planctomycetota bacterium]